MDVTIIKGLRTKTGASIADCKTCLDEADGDIEKALEFLRKRGAEIARKKSDRETSEGYIGSYVHTNGKVASLVALQCETDFVARNVAFQELANNLAMQVTAMDPEYLRAEDAPKGKTISDNGIFLKQAFIKDETKTIAQLIEEKIQLLGENIEIGEFTRIAL